jgi:hypothetical protein
MVHRVYHFTSPESPSEKQSPNLQSKRRFGRGSGYIEPKVKEDEAAAAQEGVSGEMDKKKVEEDVL